MCKQLWALALSCIMLMASVCPAVAAARGPAATAEELRQLLAAAHQGDVILIDGDISCEDETPMTTSVSVRITSATDAAATISGLRLEDADVSFSNIHLTDTLEIDGHSTVYLLKGTHVTGADGQSGVDFSGSGMLIAERGSSITGGSGKENGGGSAGLTISHQDGELYASLEGKITGGSGHTGGAGVIVSPLNTSGAMMITGSIQGGEGDVLGGNALNLYKLSGNAFVTVDGDLNGGSGAIGGDGVQLVSAVDSVHVGIEGQITGGSGDAYGGDAVMLMDAQGASSMNLSGEFRGGNALGEDAQPGTALQLVGDMTSLRTRVDDCLLIDGSRVTATARPAAQITSLPGIISSADGIDILESVEPTIEPTPEPTAESTLEPTIEPTPGPTAEPTPEPTAEPTPEPTAEPTPEPTAKPTPEPTVEPMLAPTAEPTIGPIPEPTSEPAIEPTPKPQEATPGEAN